MQWGMLAEIWEYAVAGLLLGMQLAGLVLAGRVVLSRRSTQGTIAWALSLVALPVLAVPLYLVFGRNRLDSYVRARRRVDEQFMRTHPDEHKVEGSGEVAQGSPWQLLADLAGHPVTGGNRVEFYFDGQETYASILAGLEQARAYILFQFYIFREDGEGQRFVELLKAKARAGVRVYFLVDAIGSAGLRRGLFRELTEAGVHARVFSPGRSLKGRLRVNFRNHRKVVVVDGKAAWVGGHNIGEEYVGKKVSMGPWRDSHLRATGPVVDVIQLAFEEDWYWVTREMPELHWGAAAREPGGVRAVCLATGPADHRDICTLAHVHLINQARHRLWIHSPYFVPGEEVIVALQLASLRGVDVRVVMPSRRDHHLVWLCSFYFSSLPELNKVRFFRYTVGFFHSKMLLVDDEIVSVGTVNFDNRSFRINFEITLLLQDAQAIAACRTQMEHDFARSIEDPVDPLAERGLAFRLAARGARLLSPLL